MTEMNIIQLQSQKPFMKKNIISISTSISTRIHAIIEKYKPFIPTNYHFCFDDFPSDDISFIHYLIFAVWFCSQMGISVNKMDFYTLHNSFKHLPFHSFLLHIR